jgi:hypothetical protein
VRHRITVERVLWMYHLIVLPGIEYGMRHFLPPGKQMKLWDSMVGHTVTMAATGNVFGSRRVKPEAVSSITGLVLPSMHECAVKISETFFRLNGDSSFSNRVGRLRWTASHDHVVRRNRLLRVRSLLASINWQFHNTPTGSLLSHESTPDMSDCNSSFMMVNSDRIRLISDWLGTWGHSMRAPDEDVIAYTDGSADRQGHSSWAVCFADNWFNSNYPLLPDEHRIRASHISEGVSMSGANATSYSTDIYDAELQAILRAVIAPPVKLNVTQTTRPRSRPYASRPPATGHDCAEADDHARAHRTDYDYQKAGGGAD